MKINEFGRFSQTYTEKPYGFYKLGFSTTIHSASDKDIELAPEYGKQLISDFQNLSLDLLKLEAVRNKDSLTSQTTTYYVKIGKIYWGKLMVSIEKYPFTTNIILVYKYRANARELFTIKNHDNPNRRAKNERRNKHDQYYKKYKED